MKAAEEIEPLIVLDNQAAGMSPKKRAVLGVLIGLALSFLSLSFRKFSENVKFLIGDVDQDHDEAKPLISVIRLPITRRNLSKNHSVRLKSDVFRLGNDHCR